MQSPIAQEPTYGAHLRLLGKPCMGLDRGDLRRTAGRSARACNAQETKGCTNMQGPWVCGGQPEGMHERAVPWRGRDARACSALEREGCTGARSAREEGRDARACGPEGRDGMRRRDARACRAQRRRDARTCRARSRGSPPTGPTGGSPGSPAWASTGGETCGGQPEWMHEHAAPPGRKGCTIVPGLEGRGRTGVQGPAA